MARNVKTNWPLCTICGTDQGKIPQRGKTPARFSLARFGMEGVGCLTCYNRLSQKEYRRRKKERECAASCAKE